jgi:magnesium transporter
MLARHKAPNTTTTAVWIDLLDPSDEESKSVETEFGIHVPCRAELEEIETSSRLQFDDGVISVSVPNVVPVGSDAMPAPVGFVLTPNVLVTVRYLPLHSFDAAKADVSREKGGCGSAEIFAHVMEQMVDTGADTLEKIGVDSTKLSREIFRRYTTQRQHNIARSNKSLRNTLLTLGGYGEELSQIREIQLGLQRIIPFVLEKGQGWMSADVQARLKTVGQDLQSLTDFEIHLSNKIQFLLDAVLGFINTEQNDIFKVLTIVSVVGIPPTLIASMYGMNFHFMPEYAWPLGYAYVLALIALSIVLPVAWFKWRGWW